MPIDLGGKRALVIGASGGIGAATVSAFRAAGAHVTAAGRPGPKLDEVAAETGVPAAALDITDDAALAAFFGGTDPFDHVVVAAASTRSGSVGALSLDDAIGSMNSKFWGAYRVARAARVTDGGSITFVSGFLSRRPSAGAVLQGAINAALEALARGLALERAPVRANAVSPGLIDTPLWGGMPDNDRRELFARNAARVPARRNGTPADIALAILFLAANPYVTGTVVTVDGGATIA